MRKALVALVGTVVGGVLAFPAPAAAKEFAFQGGEAFGAPPIGMTMKGESFKEPKRVTGFTIIGVGDCPGFTGPDPLTLPIRKATDGEGIRIKRNEKELAFRWSYNDKARGIAFDLQGIQRPDPSKWIGIVSAYFKEPPGEGCASAYEIHWKAVFVGLI